MCINVYTCSVQVHEEARGRPLLWFLRHYWPLLHYWHSIYLVCVQMHVPCHKHGRGAKRTGKWGQMAGFSTEGSASHNQQHCKEESISKDLNWQLRVNSVGKITSPKITERQAQWERQCLTPWEQQWALVTGSWALQRTVTGELGIPQLLSYGDFTRTVHLRLVLNRLFPA